MAQNDRKISLALKFCGSCNPQIDLSRQAALIRQFISRGQDIETVAPDSAGIDVLILLCGCPRACIDKEELKSRSRQVILISGELLNRTICPEKDLSAAIISLIEKIAPLF